MTSTFRLSHVPVLSEADSSRNFEELQTLLSEGLTAANASKALLERPMAKPEGAMKSQARVLGTAYQPSTTRPTFVLTVIELSAKAENAFAEVLMDSANPPTTAIAKIQDENANAATVKLQLPVAFLVPASFYYILKKGAGTVAIVTTFEYTL